MGKGGVVAEDRRETKGDEKGDELPKWTRVQFNMWRNLIAVRTNRDALLRNSKLSLPPHLNYLLHLH
jgi:hypothetical protein